RHRHHRQRQRLSREQKKAAKRACRFTAVMATPGLKSGMTAGEILPMLGLTAASHVPLNTARTFNELRELRAEEISDAHFFTCALSRFTSETQARNLGKK